MATVTTAQPLDMTTGLSVLDSAGTLARLLDLNISETVQSWDLGGAELLIHLDSMVFDGVGFSLVIDSLEFHASAAGADTALNWRITGAPLPVTGSIVATDPTYISWTESVAGLWEGEITYNLPNGDIASSSQRFTGGHNFGEFILRLSDGITGSSGNDNLLGNGGNDSINGRNGNDSIDGGDGDDALNGGAGNDTLLAGVGHDVLDGGAGTKDFAEFSGNRSGYQIAYLGLNGGSPRIKVTGPEGDATISGTEFLEFSDGAWPVQEWRFVVDRLPDGKGQLSFYQNGELIKSTNPGNPLDFAYDDATPIKPGTYEAIYRVNGHAGTKRWEFADSTGEPTVAGRSAIQIHGGNTPGDSEGCIVASDDRFLKSVRASLSAFLKPEGVPTPTETAAGIIFYDLPIPIAIEVKNSIPQPTLEFSADVTDTDSVTHMIRPKQELNLVLHDDGEVPGLSKRLTIFFEVSGDATYGSDFRFGAGVSHVGGDKWKTVLDAGKHSTPIPIKIMADHSGAATEAQETIHLEIYDIQISGHPTTAKPGVWKPYGNKDAGELLFGDRTFDLTITADPPPAPHFLGFGEDHAHSGHLTAATFI